MNWVIKSFVAMICFVPFLILLGPINKNYSVRPEIQYVLFLVSSALGILLYLKFNHSDGMSFLMNSRFVTGSVIVFIFGLAFGTFANVFAGQAIVQATNPGVAIAIINTSCLIIFLGSFVLGKFYPQYFPVVELSLTKLFGIIVTLGGITILSWK